MHRTLSLTVALALALCCGAAEGQSPSEGASGAIDPQVQAELSQLLSRRNVARVSTPWGELELTNPRLFDPAHLDFTRARPIADGAAAVSVPQPLPLADISELQLRKNAARRGAVIGGLIGGGFALLSILPFATACGEVGAGESCGLGSPAVTGAVLVVGTGGAGVGALIGASVKRWKTVYQAH